MEFNNHYTDCTTYQSCVVALRTWLDPGNKTLAALDFRQIIQKETESVSDFIRRLEHSVWSRSNVGRDQRCPTLWQTLG